MMKMNCELMSDEDSTLETEIETLKSIYIHELEVEYDDCGKPDLLTIHLYPATADNITEQFVKLSLIIQFNSQYPKEIPKIVIRNTRGLSDDEIESIYQAIQSLAVERKDSPMLFELIEVAKEKLTKINLPSCQCAICLYGFIESDVLTKTECFHYFHTHCLTRYVLHFLQETKETKEKMKSDIFEDNILNSKVICPVCRLPISFTPNDKSFPPPVESEKDIVIISPEIKSMQKQMKKLYSKQKQKGGIINIEEEKNRFLLEISAMPNVSNSANSTSNISNAAKNNVSDDDKKEEIEECSKKQIENTEYQETSKKVYSNNAKILDSNNQFKKKGFMRNHHRKCDNKNSEFQCSVLDNGRNIHHNRDETVSNKRDDIEKITLKNKTEMLLDNKLDNEFQSDVSPTHSRSNYKLNKSNINVSQKPYKSSCRINTVSNDDNSDISIQKNDIFESGKVNLPKDVKEPMLDFQSDELALKKPFKNYNRNYNKTYNRVNNANRLPRRPVEKYVNRDESNDENININLSKAIDESVIDTYSHELLPKTPIKNYRNYDRNGDVNKYAQKSIRNYKNCDEFNNGSNYKQKYKYNSHNYNRQYNYKNKYHKEFFDGKEYKYRESDKYTDNRQRWRQEKNYQYYNNRLTDDKRQSNHTNNTEFSEYQNKDDSYQSKADDQESNRYEKSSKNFLHMQSSNKQETDDGKQKNHIDNMDFSKYRNKYYNSSHDKYIHDRRRWQQERSYRTSNRQIIDDKQNSHTNNLEFPRCHNSLPLETNDQESDYNYKESPKNLSYQSNRQITDEERQRNRTDNINFLKSRNKNYNSYLSTTENQESARHDNVLQKSSLPNQTNNEASSSNIHPNSVRFRNYYRNKGRYHDRNNQVKTFCLDNFSRKPLQDKTIKKEFLNDKQEETSNSENR